jgi:hypothetical protein
MSLEDIRRELEQERGAKEVRRPDRTIKVEIHFWTNGIAREGGKVVPKVCMDSGVVQILENKGHGIAGEGPIPFNSFSKLVDGIEKEFRRVGIKVLKTRDPDIYYP